MHCKNLRGGGAACTVHRVRPTHHQPPLQDWTEQPTAACSGPRAGDHWKTYTEVSHCCIAARIANNSADYRYLARAALGSAPTDHNEVRQTLSPASSLTPSAPATANAAVCASASGHVAPRAARHSCAGRRTTARFCGRHGNISRKSSRHTPPAHNGVHIDGMVTMGSAFALAGTAGHLAT